MDKKRKQKNPIIKNIIYAMLVLVVLSLYFLDFFRVSLYGNISDTEKGFEMAIILFGNRIAKNEMLTLVNTIDTWKIQAASITTILCIISLIALFGIFVINAILRKSTSSKLICRYVVFVLILLSIQFIAYLMLSRAVTSLFYDPCCMGVTYSGSSFSFAPLILYGAFHILFYNMNKKKVCHENQT